MNQKILHRLAVICSFLGSALGIVLTNSTELQFCNLSDPTCINFMERVGDPLFFGSFSVLLITTLLLALPSFVFRTWLWFGGWYVPLGALILISYGDPRGMNFAPSVEQMTFYVTSIFILVSLAIIFFSIIWSGRKGK